MAVQEYRKSDHRRIESTVLIRSPIIISLLCILLALPFTAGCRKQSNTAQDRPAISVTDSRGKVIGMTKPAQRIVSLLESATTGLYMLRAEHSLVGISSNIYNEPLFPYYSSLDERIRQKELPAPGNWDAVSLENVVALQPDLVIIWASQSGSIEALEAHGLNVYGVDIRSTDDIKKEIRDLGILTGRTERAEQLIAWSNTERETDMRKKKDRPRVYFMWSSGLYETAGRSSAVHNIIIAAGGENVCPSDQEHLSVNAETLIAWDPDVILMWQNDKLDPDDVTSYPILRTISAVRTRSVYELPGSFDSDLWTLKYRFAEDLLSMHLAGTNDGTVIQKHRDSIMTFLYGREF